MPLQVLDHGRRPSNFLHDGLFALWAVDFAACFPSQCLVVAEANWAGLNPARAPALCCLHKQRCPLSAHLLLVWCFQGLGGDGHHAGVTWEHLTEQLDGDAPGAPPCATASNLLHVGFLLQRQRGPALSRSCVLAATVKRIDLDINSPIAY